MTKKQKTFMTKKQKTFMTKKNENTNKKSYTLL